MSFVSPWLLLLGLAVAVPVMLHLMHRRPGPRLDFPALRYLRRAERESGRRVRLRQFLLLALRIAAVALIATAAARPFLRGGGGAHPPTDVVIVLDNSMSTGAVVDGERVFDALVAAARASLAAGQPEDRFWLIRAAEPWEPALLGDRDRIRGALALAQAVDAAADLSAAVRRARALLAAASGERPREIHLLTDLQASAFGGTGSLADGSGNAGGEGLGGDRSVVDARETGDANDIEVLVFAPATSAPANRGIGTVQVAGGLAPRSGESASLSAQVVGAGPDSVTLRLWIDERPVAAALAAPGEAAVFSLPPRSGGVVTGRIEAEPDALRADDRRHFAYRVVPPVAVAASTTSSFVEEGLASLAAAGRIVRSSGAGADVLIADAATLSAAPADASALVLLPPDSAVLLPAANAALARLGVPWRMQADPATGLAGIRSGDATVAALLRDARVARAYRLVPAGNATGPAAADTPGLRTDTLLHLSDVRPWLIATTAASGQRVLVLATPLSLDASTIPASAAMIPLLDRMSGEWAGITSAEPAALEGGRTVALHPRATALVGPDDSVRSVEGGAPFRMPARAGVYRALAGSDPGSELLAAYAVATPPAESRLDRIAPAALEDAIDADAVIDDGTASWSDAIFVEETGGGWWRALALAALFALLAETIVAATRRAAATSE